MSRTMKRVPMDFRWPLKKVWGGYRNPFSSQAETCPSCDGSGLSPRAKLISDQWYGYVPFDPAAYGATPLTLDHPAVHALACHNATGAANIEREALRLYHHWKTQWCHHLIQADVDALVADDRLWDFTRRPCTDGQRQRLQEASSYWLSESNGYTPTADEVNLWSFGGLGHDAINSHVCVRARCAREGVSMKCHHCSGEGTMWPTEAIRLQHDEWQAIDPPSGPGFQLWETCSEGSPISPVFASLDELCVYASRHCTTFGNKTASASAWRSMLDDDFVFHEDAHGNTFI